MPIASEITSKSVFSTGVPTGTDKPESAPINFGNPRSGLKRGADSRRAAVGDEIQCTLSSLISSADGERGPRLIQGDETYVRRAGRLPLSFAIYRELLSWVDYIDVTPGFRRVIDYFDVPESELPAS